MKILVTGHLGFIGHNMTAWLLGNGHDVEGYDWDPNEFPDVRGFDWVIHLGAIADTTATDVDQILKQNLEFSQRLFTECQLHDVGLQYASSSSVYGNVKDFSEFAPCHPQNPYAWSKYLFDRWVFQQPITTPVQGFRYFNVYGRFQHLRSTRANVIHKWREQARSDGRIIVWDQADKIKRDWTFVGDICKLQLDFINTVKGSGIWNVGAGLPHSFLDIAEYIAEQEGAKIQFEPMTLQQTQAMRWTTCADHTHLKATIGPRQWLNVYDWIDQS
jgi:ADP-L-glycero-D-manno-heptose 6-epimerase